MTFIIRGEPQLKAVARDLRRAGSSGRGLRSKMRKAIVVAVQPMKRAVQASALAIPVLGGKSSGLRAAIAAATQIQIRASDSRVVSVRVWVSPARMPAGKAALPAYMDGTAGEWTHPVYGMKTVWVSQESHPYFERPAMAHMPEVYRAVGAAVAVTAAEIERGT